MEKVAINEICGGQIMMTLTKEKKSILLKIFLFLFPQIDNHRNEHHVEPTVLNGDDIDDCKSHVTFSITDAIRKSRNFMKNSSDSNNNYNKIEAEESPDYFPPADQNNNDSDVKKSFVDSYRSSSKLRNHQMQQLLQQHVFTPHQVIFCAIIDFDK